MKMSKVQKTRSAGLTVLTVVGCLVSVVTVSLSQTLERVRSDSELQAIADSVLSKYTLDELIEFQKYYDEQTSRILQETDQLRERGIRDMEAFIKGHPNSPILDKILIRLAHMYYQQAVQDFGQANEIYSQKLSLYEEGKIPEPPEEPVKDYSRALALYDRILDEFPESSLVDDAMYNKGFLLEDMGQTQEAFQVFHDLIARFPDSRYSPIAYMRMGEYYFNPPVNDIEKAIEYYKKVLQYKESSKYDAALYKLGWAYYRLSDYPSAISYFTILADDIDRARELDPQKKYHFPAVRDEAVEYIGISFIDYGGPERAAEYFTEIGGRDYGFEVLKKIGDSYMEVKEEYENAIKTYQLLLAMYPDSPAAPEIQAKIAEGYRQLEDERMAYVRRAELFRKYRADSEWWEQVDDPTAKETAQALAEKALRENITLLLRRAEETNDENLYYQAVNDSRDYLKSFPDDSNAVLIHWNMALTLDTKLHLRDEAYEEYLRISNLYWGTRFQKQAAENAIAIADEALRLDSLSTQAPGLDSLARRDSLQLEQELEPEALSPAEQRLVEALNNYIRLFPHDPSTAQMLSKAGAVYYERHQFKESLKYFKTLIRHFPDSEEADYARFIAMESYFGRRDFASTEIMARKLRSRNSEYSRAAAQRLSESIFLRAKTLADSGRYVEAAKEYRRVATEVPNAEFADLALFNAAVQYEQAQQYALAVDSYTRLLEAYPKSENYVQALNNLAFDYRELDDHTNAALTFQRLAELAPTPEEAQVALYNASVSFVEAGDWKRAIDVNNTFVNRFPEAEDADELLFNNAQYYLKLNDIASANDIYAEFAKRFPDSPRVVEAHYHRGLYYTENDRLAEAKAEFEKAVRRNDELKRNNQEANDFYAAEALFQLAEIKFREFQQIKLTLPEATLAANKKRKKALLLELVDDYTKVAGYGTFRLYQATYRVGNCYEEFAATWAAQELPDLDENERILRRKDIHDAAAKLYEQAVDSYKKSVDVLTKLSETYRESLQAQNVEADSATARAHRLAAADTTLEIAAKWIARCQEKVSEDLYQIAELKLASVYDLLRSPLPPDIQKLEELVYRKQLLTKAILPVLKEAVEAHVRNLNEGLQLGLENDWLQRSKQQIVKASNLVPNQFQRLGQEALQSYGRTIPAYKQLIEKRDEAAFDLADQMSNFLELSKSFALAAGQEFANNLQRFRELDLQVPEVVATEERLLRLCYETYLGADSLSAQAAEQRTHYENLFNETNVQDYEDAFLAFEDAYYSLSDLASEILELGFNTSRDLELVNEWSRKIVYALVKQKPEQYATELGLIISTREIVTASDWLASASLADGWNQSDFADSVWVPATVTGPGPHFGEALAQKIWLQASDHSVDSVAASNGNGMRKVYFRKTFEVHGLPVSAMLRLYADDSYHLFVNGVYVAELRADETDGKDGQVQYHDLTDYVASGANVLAVEVLDSDGSGGGLEAVLEIKDIPDWQRVQPSNHSTEHSQAETSQENKPEKE